MGYQDNSSKKIFLGLNLSPRQKWFISPFTILYYIKLTHTSSYDIWDFIHYISFDITGCNLHFPQPFSCFIYSFSFLFTVLHCFQSCVSSFLQSPFDKTTTHKTFGSCLVKLITAHDPGVWGWEDVYTTRRVIIWNC